MLVLEGYGLLVPSRPLRSRGGMPLAVRLQKPGLEPKQKPLRCPDGKLVTKQGCKPKPPMRRPEPFRVPMVRPLIEKRPTKPAVMVKPSMPMPDTTLIEKAKVEVTPEIKAPVITKPKQEGPSIATMAMVGIPLAVVTYFMAT